jgi:hypothetical protein
MSEHDVSAIQPWGFCSRDEKLAQQEKEEKKNVKVASKTTSKKDERSKEFKEKAWLAARHQSIKLHLRAIRVRARIGHAKQP